MEESILKKIEEDTINFIKTTPDFAKYHDTIRKWFSENEKEYDIEKAYKIIKEKTN